MSIVELRDLRKSYGATVAVSGITLTIEEPGVLAILGPNGAGKTTTLEILLGLRRPDAGEARVFGVNPMQPQVRTRIGAAPQQSGVPPTLRVREIVEFVAAQYPRPRSVSEMLDAFGLTKLARRQCGGLSGGELRRLSLAIAFVGQPDLAVLDEPTNGLDLEARRAVWDYVRAYAAYGGTVLLTTHYMEEAEALASRIVVVGSGRILREGTPEQIRQTSANRRLIYVDASGKSVTLAAADTDAAVRELVRSNVPFSNLQILSGTLEDAVLSLLEERL